MPAEKPITKYNWLRRRRANNPPTAVEKNVSTDKNKAVMESLHSCKNTRREPGASRSPTAKKQTQNDVATQLQEDSNMTKATAGYKPTETWLSSRRLVRYDQSHCDAKPQAENCPCAYASNVSAKPR
jgi:hypothetical protein